jgi:F0F1-type ATP synthase assembly protein I
LRAAFGPAARELRPGREQELSKRQRDSEGSGSGGLGSKEAKAYQWAFEAVLSIPIAMGLGYWADRAWGTSPIGLVVGAVLGFAAFVRRLISMRSLVPPAADPANPGQTPPPEDVDEASAPSETDEK